MAAGSTYTPIATTTLGSAATSVTFSSISGAYTDLIVISSISITAGADDLRMQLNSDTATNYSDTILKGNGTSATSRRNTSGTGFYISWDGNLSTTISTYINHIMNYSNTSTYKTVLSRSNGTSGLDAVVSLWRSTAAINTVKIYSASNFAIGSTFTLYGIAAA